MRAAIVHAPGPPEALRLEEIAQPEPRAGFALIRVRAFGLNYSELQARRGEYPEVTFPRILGTECVGEIVASAADTPLPSGQLVAAVMGGMGRLFDGAYAEYILAPTGSIMPVQSDLPWETLAAIPKSFLTASQALDTLDLTPGQTLLIRGGTSSVGMAALALAKGTGVATLATTRNPAKIEALRAAGADEALVDSGVLAEEVQRLAPGGVHAVLELVGAATLRDSLLALAPGGIVCYMGGLGRQHTLRDFSPLGDIPSGARLTAYGSRGALTGQTCATELQRIVDGVRAGHYRANLDRVFAFEDIVAAHQYVEESRGVGKVVVTI